MAKYVNWKRRNEGLVMAATEGDIEGKCLPVRRRTSCINGGRRWTVGGLTVAQGLTGYAR